VAGADDHSATRAPAAAYACARMLTRALQGALGERDQRPWPLPDGPWVQGQTWLDLLFAHWSLPVEAVRPAVPAELPVDTLHFVERKEVVIWAPAAVEPIRRIIAGWTRAAPIASAAAGSSFSTSGLQHDLRAVVLLVLEDLVGLRGVVEW
jgi:hypothetical protein